MSAHLDLTIVYEPGEEGWVIASIPEVAGVFSQGSLQSPVMPTIGASVKHCI